MGTVSPQLVSLLPSIQYQKEKVWTVSPQSTFPPEELIRRLSYSHFEILVSLNDPDKRFFYEYESIRGNWSVRELKRQVASLYFERTGLSIDKKKLTQMVQAQSEPISASQIIRDPYIFEFLGIRAQDVMSESLLEDQLITKIQHFLLELGRGFCFEARQKRILIGGEHYFIDLVFYHRILKCHILIELKADEFTHEHIGQLNSYVNWYRKNEMADGDNLPIGILLCTKKNQTLVEYALAGMDNQIFVSKYLIKLPQKDEIRRFLEDQIEEW